MPRQWLVVTIIVLSAAVVTLMASLPVQAGTTINVNSTLDVLDSSDGKCTLREAVIAANTDKPSGGAAGECPAGSGGDTIVLPDGTFLLTIPPSGGDDATTGDLNITTTVAIRGAGEAATIIDGNGLDRIFNVRANQFSLSGVRIQNGHASSDAGGIVISGTGAAPQFSLSNLSVVSNTTTNGGGGMFVLGGRLTMTNVLLNNNRAEAGGGIDASFSVATLNNVTITNNIAGNGPGGGLYTSHGALTLNGVNISNNQTASTGAGIQNESALTVTNSALVSNTAAYQGGAIWNQASATATLSLVALMSNSAQFGGGLWTLGSARLEDVTLSANSAITEGGGIYNLGTTELTNVTLSGNQAPGFGHLGGGIYQALGTLTLVNATLEQNTAGSGPLTNRFPGGSVYVVSGTVQMKNSIVDLSSGNTCLGPVTSLGHNLESKDLCNFHQTGDLTGTNPLLGPLANNGGTLFTHALLAGSPAIDAGDNVDCPPFDERGALRPQGAACDMGAYEFGAKPLVSALVPASALVHSPAFALSLRGSGFILGASAQWNGSALATTFISPTLLSAIIPASNLSATGAFSVTVQNPGPGDGVSSPLPFAVTPHLLYLPLVVR